MCHDALISKDYYDFVLHASQEGEREESDKPKFPLLQDPPPAQPALQERSMIQLVIVGHNTNITRRWQTTTSTNHTMTGTLPLRLSDR